MNNKYKILLVEDEPSIRKYVNALLNASGYIVIEAANCAEAKPCFLSHTPDLVLLDLGLPDGDGMQLLEFIRSRSAVPVIVLSARSDETDKVVRLTAVQMIMLQSLSVRPNCLRECVPLSAPGGSTEQAKRTAGSASAHSRSIAMPAAFLRRIRSSAHSNGIQSAAPACGKQRPNDDVSKGDKGRVGRRGE